jgi:hypothetical protein
MLLLKMKPQSLTVGTKKHTSEHYFGALCVCSLIGVFDTMTLTVKE